MKKELSVEIVGIWVDRFTMDIFATLQFKIGSYQTLDKTINLTKMFRKEKPKKK